MCHAHAFPYAFEWWRSLAENGGFLTAGVGVEEEGMDFIRPLFVEQIGCGEREVGGMISARSVSDRARQCLFLAVRT